MKKMLALVLAVCMLLSMVSAACAGTMLENGRYDKLVVAIDTDPQDLEGDDVNIGSRYYWIYGIYEPLFDFADDSTGKLLPCMATGYEEADGGKSWKVTLNNDVYDWDGNNITSSDVKFCFDWIVERGQALRFDFFESIEPIDDYTFYIHWKQVPPAISELEFPLARTLIFSEKAYKDHNGMTQDPCGTGCYKVTSFTPGSKVIMQANDNYWGLNHPELSPRHTATVQTLELDVINEASTAVIGLEKGNVDVCSYVPLNMLDEFETGKYAADYNVEIMTQGDYWFMAPNAQSVNLDLRKAIFYAMDNTTLCKFMGGAFAPATTIGTEAYADYDPALEMTDTFITQYDLEKAKEYVKSSGYDGRELNIVTFSGEVGSKCLQAIQILLQQVGINSKLSVVTPDVYRTITSASHSKDWDILVQTLGGPSMVGSWHLLFDHEVNNGYTLSMHQDETLQALYEAATADATHDTEHMRAVLDWNTENACIYPIAKISTGLVYTKDIQKMFYREGYYTPGASEFVK